MVGDLHIRIAKLAFHAKESPFRTRDEVFNLVSSQSNSPAKVYSAAVRGPLNPGLPQAGRPRGVPASDVEMGGPGRCPRVVYEAWPGILSPCRKSSRRGDGVTSFVSLCLLTRVPNPLRFGYLIRGASGLIALTITWA